MFGIIYKITNKLNGKRYIGQTIQPLNYRWNEHCSKRSRKIYYVGKAVEKYGKENFTIEIVSHCNSMEEMNRRESYYIKLFNTLSPNGYNLDSGGKNKLHHAETKRKMSEARKGSKHPLFGIGHTKEAREKMSKSRIGMRVTENTKLAASKYHKGKPKSEKQRLKMSRSALGKPKSPEHIRKIALLHRKPIKCNNTLKIYSSIKEACETLKMSYQTINLALKFTIKKGKNKGCSFSYVNICND